MSDRRYVWLKMLVSASMVASLVPAPALAEVIDEGLPSEEVAAPEEAAEDAEKTEEPAAPDTEDAGSAEQKVAAPAPVSKKEGAVDPKDDSDGESKADKTEVAEPELTAASEGEPNTMKLDTPISISIEEGSYWVGSFTAPENGTYVFESSNYSNDPYGILYEDEGLTSEIGSDDDAGEDWNFRITAVLDKDATVYLKASSSSGESDSYDVCVSKLDASDLSRATFLLDSSTYVETESPVELDHAVIDADSNHLTEGVDYELVYSYWDDEEDEEVETTEAPSAAGEYYVYARACEGSSYDGQTDGAGFEIVSARDLWRASFELEQTSFDATGSGEPVDVAPYVTVFDLSGKELTRGVDYELVYSYRDDESGEDVVTTEAPSAAGEYYVYARACEGSSYYGDTGGAYITIVSVYDLSRADFSLMQSDFTENESGEPVDVAPYVTVCGYAGNLLTEGVDYELVYSYRDDETGEDVVTTEAPSAAGEYYVYARAREGGSYDGQTDGAYFTIISINDLSRADFSLTQSDFTENESGEPVDVAPYVTVCDLSGKELTGGVDYELVYSHWDDESGEDVVTTEAPSAAGEYYVYARACEGSSYDGQTDGAYITIVSPRDLSRASFDLEKTSFELSGPGEPVDVASYVTVIDSLGNTLTGGFDYELVYSYWDDAAGEYVETTKAPSAAGEYDVWARAVEGGNYEGNTDAKSFEIVDPFNITGDRYYSYFWPSDTVAMTGKPIELPQLIISLEDEDGLATFLTEGTDYVFDHFEDDEYNTLPEAPSEKGEYVAYYKGIGAYSGTIGHYFYVDEVGADGTSLDEVSVDLEKNGFAATGLPIEPDVRMVDGGNSGGYILEEGVDYAVARYEDGTGEELSGAPSDPGEYYVVYKGIGAYSGSVSCRFSIYEETDLHLASFELMSDWILLEEGVEPKIDARVRNSEGKLLKEGTDFELVYFKSSDELDGKPTSPGWYKVAARALEGSGYTGQTETCDFWLSAGEEGPTEGQVAATVDMVLDESYEASLNAKEYLLGTFVVPENGIYEFVSAGDDDTYGELYADEQLTDCIAYNDDGGDGYNFRVVDALEAGQTVYLRVRGYSWSAADFTVQVKLSSGKNLSEATFDLLEDTYGATGQPVSIEVKLTDLVGNTLTEGVDYELAFCDSYYDEDEDEEWPSGDVLTEAPTEIGVYYVRAVGKGNYEDSTDWYRFEIIDASDLSFGSISIDGNDDNTVARGDDVAAAVVVTDARDATLTAGTHYDLQFRRQQYNSYVLCDSVPSEVGRYYVRALAKEGSGYTGKTGWYRIDIVDLHNLSNNAEIDLEDCAYSDDGFYVYRLTGSEVKPTVVVRLWNADGKPVTLTEGTDYTVSYKNNTKATTYSKLASVTITGTGTYTGSCTEYFEITDKLDLAQSIAWHGVYLDYDGSHDFAPISSYVGNSNISYLTNPSGVKPTVSISSGPSGAVVPVAGTDFTVSYVDVDENEVTPTTVGSYAVLLTATSSRYEGTALLPFDLVENKSLEHHSLSLGMNYDGFATYQNRYAFNVYAFAGSLSDLASAVSVTLYDGSKALTANVDYLIETVVDSAAGFIKFIISGVTGGRYLGSVTGAVYSKKLDLGHAQVSVGKAVYGAAKPSVSVSVYGPTVSGRVNDMTMKTLVQGTDYTVSYDTTKFNVGDEATLTITGIGGYSGTATATYVVQKGVSKISLANKTATYTGKAIAYSGTVTRSGSTGAVSYAYFSDAACTKSVKTADVKAAGTYYVKATLAADAKYEAAASAPAKLTIAKAANPYKAKARAKKQTVNLAKVTKAKQTLANNVKVTKKAQGKVTYANGKANAKTKKWVVNKKTGKVTVPKGTKKGTYTIKVKATAAGNANFNKKTVTIKYKIVVK